MRRAASSCSCTNLRSTSKGKKHMSLEIEKSDASEDKATDKKQIESLDQLLEVIEGDELRHVIGGGRPKDGPFEMQA